MERYIKFADKLSTWFGHTFAWLIMLMTFGVSYEVFVRYALSAPTPWAFDVTYIMYGTLFMMAGAYTLSQDGHVRADFIYRLWKPRTQAVVELVLYFLFFFPGILALIFAGWKYAQPLVALPRGQHHEPGEHPDLPVQDGDRGRGRADLPPGAGAGLPLHHLHPDRRLAGQARGRRGARAGADQGARARGGAARPEAADRRPEGPAR